MSHSVANADHALHLRIVAVALTASSTFIAAALLASVAGAADLPASPPAYKAAKPAVISPYHWTGFYLGAQIGYGWGRSSGTQNAGGTFFPVVPYTIDPDGALAGGDIGFDRQNGEPMVGTQGALAVSKLSGGTAASAFNPTYAFNVEADWLASVHGRMDWAQVGTPRDNLDRQRTGRTVGAGAEHVRPRKWSARVEELNFHAVRLGVTRRLDVAP